MLSHLERAVDVKNAFDDQIDGEDQHDEVQPGTDTIEQSQSRADSNQCENSVEPARSDVFVKDGDQERNHAADQGENPKKPYNEKGEKQWRTYSQKANDERENGANDKPGATFAIHSRNG